MRILRRPLAPRELDHEFIWLSVTLGGLAFAATWFAIGLPWPHCVFLTITGHPCMTCGATRSAIAFFQLDFAGALKWNPLVFAILCGFSIFDFYAFVVLIMRAPRLRIQFAATEKKFIRLAAFALLVSNWLYLLSRPRALF
jgi:Protein of unknown function (DUF2752).